MKMRGEPSYVHGTSSEPLRPLTVAGCLDETARRFPDNEALVVPHQSVRWTYRELAREVDRYAAGLVALGLEPGERIGIWAPNCWEWVVTQFASAKAGLVLVNINLAYRLGELTYALDKVGCAALITAPRLMTSDYVAMLRELVPELAHANPGALRSARFPDLKSVVVLGEERFRGFLNFTDIAEAAGPAHRERLAELEDVLQFDDPINIQFTSGTTGAPKAATLTHHNIVNNAWFVGRQMKLTDRDRMCIPVPMYHCFGMVLGTLCCVVFGAAMVFASESYEAGEVLKAVEAERCTVLHGVPTMFIAELDDPGFASRDLSSLRTGIMAGAPCPVELMRRVMREMHMAEITIAYGMTETGPVSFQTSVDDPLERRVTTVGRVLPHVEVKIVDDEGRVLPRVEVRVVEEGGGVVPRDTAGELLTRGYCVMPRYWADPERTAKAIDEARWIASGDVAVIDGEGYCQIVGRVKDMVIRGGEKIFPREVEEFLYTHPKIEQAEVFGVPDEKYGEQVAAWIKLRAGETATAEEVRQFCKGRIAHFKVPYYVKFVDTFPMTVTGKVQKYIMREEMTDELEKERKAAGR